MQIAHIDIQNFRKLRCCRVELANQQTIFVGANNSGKTSAMDALILFLKDSRRRSLSTTDFTLSNWLEINKIGHQWSEAQDDTESDLSLDKWRPLLPSIDVWLHVNDDEVHFVSHILPTLDWSGGLLGVRLVLEPSDIEQLYKDFRAARIAAKNTLESRYRESGDKQKATIALWPTSMRDFLDKNLHKYFVVKQYVLDPSKAQKIKPQELLEEIEPLESDSLDGLFKIDVINAQRGFNDPSSLEAGSSGDRRLSSQLRAYFDKHLDPTDLPDAKDLEALEAIEAARTAFDEKLKTSFGSAIGELEGMNYPGFSDPQIVISSKLSPVDGINHDSAVQFRVVKSEEPIYQELRLPERFNGLGYQNLISMIFNLIRYRDEWMRVGKAGKKSETDSKSIQPLHIVLVEEPEAHLHAQVQQVFVKKAYAVLRNHAKLGQAKNLSTQLIISTHSSHIAHETDFSNLRYFRREIVNSSTDVPSATIVNMTETFGEGDDTAKFAKRYLKTTHCDLFFADAVILVEGPAERILMPHFIRNSYPDLDKAYICLLEIGGSHAHRLRPLIESLGVLALIITDLDSIEADGKAKTQPVLGKSLRTGNDTLKTWVPCKTNLDELVALPDKLKVSEDGRCRVAYPGVIEIEYEKNPAKAIPYTFEDALALQNLPFFKDMTGSTGLVKKLAESVNKPNLDEACRSMFEALFLGKKAEMALELLFTTDPVELNPPKYIADGLTWLSGKLVEGWREPTLSLVESGGKK